MPLPNDMKNYRPSEDAFQIVPPSFAMWALIYGVILGLIFSPVIGR